MTTTAGERHGITWRWSFFLLGVVYALPAVAVAPSSPQLGLALAIGVMPVAAFNLPGVRRGRRIIPFVGALSGVSFVAGSLLTQVPVLAVTGMFVLALGASLWARRSRTGALALALCVPLVGIGLSIPSIPGAMVLGMCIVIGSVYAYAVSMLWPEHQVPPPVRTQTPSRADAVVYGVLLGLAGASAAAIGYLLHLEHVGWATGSALLVMRPVREQLVRRSIGRALSVLVGAFAAAAFALTHPTTGVTAVVIGVVLASLSATQASRWYVAPGFTSFIVLTMLLTVPGARPAERFLERVLETLLGVGLALLFGAVVPAIIRARRRRGAASLTSEPGDPPSGISHPDQRTEL